jgi:polysaccharide biosynthesis protein PslH
MANDRLTVLFLSPFPPAPPTFGAQRRIQGLMAATAKYHDVLCISLISPDLDLHEADCAMRDYCRDVVLVPTRAWQGSIRRIMQARSLISTRSFESRVCDVPELRRALNRVLLSQRVDVVNVELPFLAGHCLWTAPPPLPIRVLDEHNLEFDLRRQQASTEQGVARRVHNIANWPKVRREELGAFCAFDGVVFCSDNDETRARALVPQLRSTVVPNAVDVDYFNAATAGLPPSDGRTVMFFGAIDYFPNLDGLRYLHREVWPLVERSHPHARLKIVGQHPTPEVKTYAGPHIDVTGKVDDLRPHLASSACTIVPLRIGGGTRLKILESMAMARPVVSTTLGAEGIEARSGKEILLGDNPQTLAAHIGRILDNPALGAELGARGRALVEERYCWAAAARRLETFWQNLLARPQL